MTCMHCQIGVIMCGLHMDNHVKRCMHVVVIMIVLAGNGGSNGAHTRRESSFIVPKGLQPHRALRAPTGACSFLLP